MTEIITAPVITACSQHKLVTWQFLPFQLYCQIASYPQQNNNNYCCYNCLGLLKVKIGKPYKLAQMQTVN